MTHKPTPIIGLSGKQFAGKDVLARYLLSQLPGFRQSPIAGAIKVAYAQQHGLTLIELEANKAAYRPGLIALGNWGREQDINYWLHQALQFQGHESGLIISDVRLPHEADTLSNRGAMLIRVEAERAIRAQRGRLMSEDDLTECALDEYPHWDVVLSNNGTEAAFYADVNQRLPAIRKHLGLG